MKKFYKRVNSKRLTIEGMATCIQLCSRNCDDCGTLCGGSPVNGVALLNTPAINGDLDTQLVANGSIFG